MKLTTLAVDSTVLLKRVLPVVVLAALWCWETWWPFFGRREGRLLHALHNLAIALFNTIALGLVFGAATVAITGWTQRNQFGLLPALGLPAMVQFMLALVLLDGWMYAWHRANHAIPVLWRFHRMHHSDPQVDVTTATRFHLGEHTGASLLRLVLIPLLGIEAWQIVVYDALLIGITQFHHADISLGRWDRWLRLMVVTPNMHKVHHSKLRAETDSNYSSVLSIWDRLAGTFRMRSDLKALVFGLEEMQDPGWQTWSGMWKTPLAATRSTAPARPAGVPPPKNQFTRAALRGPDHGPRPGQ